MPFEDLRQGRLDIVPNYYTVDMPFYREHLEGFLPDRMIDIHTHARPRRVWQAGDPEPTFWPGWISKGAGMTVPNLLEAFLILFPGKQVTPNILGAASRPALDALTDYLLGKVQEYPHTHVFMGTLPEWSESELIARYERGRFSGLKVNPHASVGITYDEAAVYDVIPPHQFKVAEERGWPILLHIPNAERLAYQLNIDQLKEIADTYPKVKVILAHIGRAYCPRFAEEGFARLGDTSKFYYWDFSANLLQDAMELLIEYAGPSQIVYGSDLPVVAARACRICEGDNYVNLMREADWEDSHTRLAPPDERGQVTFMIYEEIAAFRRAAEKAGLGKQEIEDIFYGNAHRLLAGAA